jgi:hypothetical protein
MRILHLPIAPKKVHLSQGRIKPENLSACAEGSDDGTLPASRDRPFADDDGLGGPVMLTRLSECITVRRDDAAESAGRMT